MIIDVIQEFSLQTMFTLSSADLNLPHRSDSEIHIPIQIQTSNEKYPTEVVTQDTAASCDDDGHIFVYDPHPPHDHVEPSGKLKMFSLFVQSIFLSFI